MNEDRIKKFDINYLIIQDHKWGVYYLSIHVNDLNEFNLFSWYLNDFFQQ